jgi:hypothetical protein
MKILEAIKKSAQDLIDKVTQCEIAIELDVSDKKDQKRSVGMAIEDHLGVLQGHSKRFKVSAGGDDGKGGRLIVEDESQELGSIIH